MVRYIGSGQSGSSDRALPQAEAQAYFARMSAAPSAGFKEALNYAVYRWKACGAWAELKGLWLLCADTQQAALLSVIGDAPRDAVVVGTAPTFTALKGFSGFDTAKQIQFPITSAIIGTGINASGIFAGQLDWPASYDPMAIVSTGAANATYIGNLGMEAVSGAKLMFGGKYFGSVPDIAGPLVIMSGAQVMYNPGGLMGLGGSFGNVSSNFITAASATAVHPLTRLTAYGFMSTVATATHKRRFLAILNNFLDEIGALD